jgi:hypothetical protein
VPGLFAFLGLGRLGRAAQRILALEDDLAAERALTARLRARAAGPGGQDG